MATGNLIRWSKPPTETSWTHTRVYRSPTETGIFTQIAQVVLPTNYYWDIDGTTTDWYRIAFYDSAHLPSPVLGDQSNAFLAGQIRGYTSIDEVRTYTLVQSSEFADDALQLFIDNATKAIDSITGRSWQGFITAENEYLDGKGESFLYLPRYDINALSKVEVLSGTGDRSVTANWVEIPLAKVLSDKSIGRLDIDAAQNPTETVFPKGIQTVRVTYNWGKYDPTDDVKYLCLLMVANQMKHDDVRKAEIDRLVSILSRKVIESP